MDELDNLKARREILSAYIMTIDNLTEVLELCGTASTDADDTSAGVDEARRRLISRFGVSDFQADAVLQLQLRRFTPGQIARTRDELADVEARIAARER